MMGPVHKMAMLLALSMILFTVTVDAWWRMACQASTGQSRIDPLISPGKAGDHLHAVFGSGAFSPTSEYKDLIASDCTTCAVPFDKSAYWAPDLWFQDSAGLFYKVPMAGGPGSYGILAYYKLDGEDGNTAGYGLEPFPPGFSMIMGNNYQRNFSMGSNVSYPVPDSAAFVPEDPQAFRQQTAIGFNCLHNNPTPEQPTEGSLTRHFLPDADFIATCDGGFRIELAFPSCWNKTAGVAPRGFKSHLAYPDGVLAGHCPPGFDTRLPTLFIEMNYDARAFMAKDGSALPGQYVLSNGDPTGFGAHADFIFGWEPNTLETAMTRCNGNATNGIPGQYGTLQECPYFNETLQANSVAAECKFSTPAALATETCTASCTALPGNVQVQSGPQPATAGTATGIQLPGSLTTSKIAIITGTPVGAGETLASVLSPGSKEAKVSEDSITRSTSTLTVLSSVTVTTSDSALSVEAPSTTPAPLDNPQSLPTISTTFFTSGLDAYEIIYVEEIITTTVNLVSTVTKNVKGRHLHVRHATRRI